MPELRTAQNIWTNLNYNVLVLDARRLHTVNHIELGWTFSRSKAIVSAALS